MASHSDIETLLSKLSTPQKVQLLTGVVSIAATFRLKLINLSIIRDGGTRRPSQS